MIETLRHLKATVGRVLLPGSPSASSLPLWEYVKWFRWSTSVPDFPRVIDIQTKTGCNARCTFCNVGRELAPIRGTMDKSLWQKIIDEILEHPEVLRIHPYLLNDPLVDADLPARLEYIAQQRGKRNRPRVHLITNGGLLTEEMSYQLLRTEALDELDLSFHSVDRDVYEKMMAPLKYDKVMDNITRFKTQWDAFKGRKPRVNIWTVLTRRVESNLRNERTHWKKVGFGFKARKLDNRGDLEIESLNLGGRAFAPVKLCAIPFWRAWIMANGDMIMCCVDLNRSLVLGNCREQSIAEIWNGKEYNDFRSAWKRNDLANLLCADCKGS